MTVEQISSSAEVKRCIRCHVEKNLSEFVKPWRDRVYNHCSECHNAGNRMSKRRHADRVRARARAYSEANRDTIAAKRAQHSARMKARTEIVVPPERKCARCGEVKSASEFRADRSKRSGLTCYCRPCDDQHQAEWRDRYRAPRIGDRSAADATHACTGCGIVKPLAEFGIDRTKSRGVHSRCKDCKRIAQAAWRDRNRERVRERARARAALVAARTVGEFTPADVYERDNWQCWVCNEPTDPNGALARRLSVDHVIPIVGGGMNSLDNVRCAHYGCNSFRFHTTRPLRTLPDLAGLSPLAQPS